MPSGGKPLWELGSDRGLATRSTWKFIDELKDRLTGIRRMIPYAAAKSVYDSVLSQIPKTEEYRPLETGLTLAEVGSDPEEPGFAVYVPLRGQKIKKIDAPRTIIYVRKRNLRQRLAPRDEILINFGPWTTDTIPFWPDKKKVVIVQRKSNKKTVDKIAAIQEKQKHRVELALGKVGFRQTKKLPKSKQPKRTKAVPDVAFLAQKLEFGQPGQRAVPAWRRSIRDFMTVGFKNLSRTFKPIDAAVSDTGDQRWKVWPRVTKRVKISEIRSASGFIKKLGY